MAYYSILFERGRFHSHFDLNNIVCLNLPFGASGFVKGGWGQLNVIILKLDLVLTDIEVKY